MKYVGNKNIPGVIEFLVNHLPKSKRYFSLFFGSGGLETSKYTDEAFFTCAEKNTACKVYESSTAVIDFLCYNDLLDAHDFNRDDFIFADPPYTFSTRRSSRTYYKFEFNTNQHIDFLNRISSINAKVMVTHPFCKLYDNYLKGWIRKDFQYQTSKGIFKDCLWMNYNPGDIVLLNYEVLGNNFIERQAIKRQRKNIITKFENMNVHIRRKIFNDLKHLIDN